VAQCYPTVISLSSRSGQTKLASHKFRFLILTTRDPQSPSLFPKKAKKGAKIAVPIPGKDQGVEEVAKKQQGMSTGSKVATGLGISVVAGAAVVGGVILGDHLAGGTLAQDVADMAVDGADAVADAAPDILEDAGDFAEDVGDWLGDAAEDVGEWICSVF